MPDDRYTHGHHDAVLRSHRFRTAENSASYLIPHLQAGMRVLDVGCGPGTITADLAKLIAPGQMVAIDRAEAVLAEASAVCTERGADNVTIEVGDVYALEFEDDSFDVVHAHQVLQHLSDPVAALREMRRVTKPDGMVAIRDADYHAMTWYPPDPQLDRWMDIYQAVARSNDAEPDGGRHLLAWANQAGFSTVESSATVWCFADAETRHWWGDLWADRMTGSAVAEQAVAQNLATEADLAEVATAFRRWLDHPDGWFTVLHGEILATP